MHPRSSSFLWLTGLIGRRKGSSLTDNESDQANSIKFYSTYLLLLTFLRDLIQRGIHHGIPVYDTCGCNNNAFTYSLNSPKFGSTFMLRYEPKRRDLSVRTAAQKEDNRCFTLSSIQQSFLSARHHFEGLTFCSDCLVLLLLDLVKRPPFYQPQRLLKSSPSHCIW